MITDLHIVSFDIPWPADYGGVIDVFYKMPALHAMGIKIHLHCFFKDRPPAQELEKHCETVSYYPRQKFIFPGRLPYIVASRKSDLLRQRLAADDYPILLEGIHTTYLLNKNDFKNRQVLLRMHNLEHIYYGQLANNELKPFRKSFFKKQSKYLLDYEIKISGSLPHLALNKPDAEKLLKLNTTADVRVIPAFVPWTADTPKGKGTYCLYHGNLSINENENAVLWLLQEVFPGLDIPFIIAGKSPGKLLREAISKHEKVSLYADPEDEELEKLISGAQVNILPSFNATGVKLKILHALFRGRHCLVNPAAVLGSDLESYCMMAETKEEFSNQVNKLFLEEIDPAEMQARTRFLEQHYDNAKNAAAIIKTLH